VESERSDVNLLVVNRVKIFEVSFIIIIGVRNEVMLFF